MGENLISLFGVGGALNINISENRNFKEKNSEQNAGEHKGVNPGTSNQLRIQDKSGVHRWKPFYAPELPEQSNQSGWLKYKPAIQSYSVYSVGKGFWDPCHQCGSVVFITLRWEKKKQLRKQFRVAILFWRLHRMCSHFIDAVFTVVTQTGDSLSRGWMPRAGERCADLLHV